MKLLTLIVHTDVQQDLVKLLRDLDEVSGFTFTHVEGHGEENENDKFLSARDKVVGFAPRIHTELLLEDNDVDTVLATLRDKEHNIAGQGIYWVTSVEKGGHLL
jgi:nitrogen regulatory protein P-II 1